MVAATAAKIAIQIEAQTAQLKAGFDKATGAINKLDKRVGNIAATMGKAVAVVAAIGVAFRGLSAALNQVNGAWQELSNNVDVADKLGVAVDELEFLQFAAAQSGISAKNLNTGLQRFTRRVSEAAKGTGELKGALIELGLDAKRLNEQSPARSMQEFAQALAEVENPADRVRLAMKAFDSEGVALKAFADLGVEGLQNLQEEFDKTGGSLGNNAEALKAAERAFVRMERAWTVALQQIAIAVAPTLERIAEAIATIVGWWNNLGKSADENSDVVEELTKEERELDKAAVGAAAALEEQNKELERLKKLREELESRAEAVTKALRTPFEVAKDAVAELNTLFDKGLISLETYGRGVKKAAEGVKDIGKAVAEVVRGPGIATAASGGFSAIQEARRNEKKREQIEREQLREARRIRELMERLDVREVAI